MSDRFNLDRIIIGLLTAGVTVSILLEIVGLVIFCHSHDRLTVSMDTTVFIHGRNPYLLISHMTSMIKEQGIDVFFMTTGIIVLIITPFMRVVTSMFYFAFKRDLKFFCITLFVFVILTISILVH